MHVSSSTENPPRNIEISIACCTNLSFIHDLYHPQLRRCDLQVNVERCSLRWRPHPPGWPPEVASQILVSLRNQHCSDISVRSSNPAQSPLSNYQKDNACDPSNFEPNLALNLEVADLINSKKGNAYETPQNSAAVRETSTDGAHTDREKLLFRLSI